MSLSKVSIFDRATADLQCQDIYHAGETCAQMWLSNCKDIAPAAGTLMAPFVLISLARKWRTLTTDDLKTYFKQWLSMSAMLWIASNVAFVLMCGLRKLLGKFNRYTIVAIPAMLGNFASFILNEKDANIFANTSVIMMLEGFYRSDETGIFTIFRNSTFARALLFMTLSAVVMDLCKIMPSSHTDWIAQPPRKPKNIKVDDDDSLKIVHDLESPVIDHLIGGPHVCLHSESCDSYVFGAIKGNFQLGVGIEVARILLGNFKLLFRSPVKLFRLFIESINLRLVGFMVGYNALYRFINCLLNRNSRKDTREANWLAAFGGGCAFYWYPNFTLLSFATVSAVRLLWSRHYQKYAFLQAINELPIAKLTWAFGSGILYYMRMFKPSICPSLLMKSTNYASGYRLENQILKNFYRNYLGFAGSA